MSRSTDPNTIGRDLYLGPGEPMRVFDQIRAESLLDLEEAALELQKAWGVGGGIFEAEAKLIRAIEACVRATDHEGADRA